MILSVSISYAIWAWRSRDSHIYTHTLKIANWHRNRISKTASPYISRFGHGRRLNSTVSNHGKQYKNLQNCRICNTLQVMQRTIHYQRLMDCNTTAVNSIWNMYPTAYLSNSRMSASFSSIVELNISLSNQVLIHV